ncbi:MAG: ORF6N domain-containing protein [Lachnospiraceae bacterium]|nr:ORF6N domain-containing protein [Lachnospiraceae bacterium]MEE1248651.1 ORF6N domain-containing protein [Lachnospiraceae bacterium]
MNDENTKVVDEKEGEDEKENQEIILINKETIQSKIYIVRGQKVMLDFELAEIYGYTTTKFNQQVKNNIEKFDEDFMFQLTKEEFDNLISKKLTSSWGGRRKLPKVFTEQGIYMLMTVLKGELATKQSKALIRTFKQMKDYIIENQDLIGEREYLQLSMQISQNIHTTMELRSDLNDVEDQMAKVIDRLGNVVTHSELSEIMNEFGEPHIKRGYLVLNGNPFKADIVYDEIYRQAKKSIFIVDNYIGLKTLEKLINIQDGVEVSIFSDNLVKGLRQSTFDDFCKEYLNLNIQLFHSGGIFHDRYIILDYGTDDEKIFLCGASSKDAGGRITSILEDPDRKKYDAMINDLLKNKKLVLK